MRTISVKIKQPYNERYELVSKLEVLNLDEERIKGINSGKDFFIKEPQNIKKDIKSEYSIFSSKYGASILDQNAYMDRYRCTCGHLRGALYNGEECPICHDKVKYVDDDFSIFGWIVLDDDYCVIHPNLFQVIASLVGHKELMNIIEFNKEIDEDGFFKETNKKKGKSDNPFYGIGMIEFAQRLDEILEYYKNKKKSNPNKIEEYEFLMKNRDKILTHSIPVYTLFLRMANLNGDQFTFVKNNKWYNNIAKNAGIINNNSNLIYRRNKTKNEALFDIQKSLQNVYDTIMEEMTGKKGVIRSVMTGRFNFTGRAVIIPDEKLEIDQIRLPYTGLVILLEQLIINYLVKSLDLSYADAYKKWFKAQIKKDGFIVNIINNMINSTERGLPFIINRNPSISYGSLLQMYCVGINEDSFTMSMPLQVLKGLGADFDGDCMNIIFIINKEFKERAEEVLNPRNSMMISHNDGRFNNDVNHFKDTYVNLNSLVFISRDKYTPEDINNIERLKNS